MTAGLIHSLFPGNVVFPHLNMHSEPYPTVLLPTDIRISPEFQHCLLDALNLSYNFMQTFKLDPILVLVISTVRFNFVICSDWTDCRRIWHIFFYCS